MNPQWQTFITISKMLDSDLPITTKIHKISQVIVDSIENADAGFLLLWNEDLQYLTIESAVNFEFEYYKNTKIIANEGISGKVFANGKSMILNSVDEINAAMNNMRVVNKNYYLQSFVHYGVPKSCISVPIEYNHQRFGVLTLDNFLNDADFTIEDLDFLQAVAIQLAIAIKLSATIQEQQQRHNDLKLVLKNHHTLNQMVLDGKNIQQLLTNLDELTNDEYFLFNSIGDFEFSTKNSAPLHNNLNCILDNHEISNAKNPTYQCIKIAQTDLFAHIFIIASSFYISGFLVFYSKENTINTTKNLILIHTTSIIAIEKIKKNTSLEKEFQKRKSVLQLIKNNATAEDLIDLDKSYFLNFNTYALLGIKNDYLNYSDFNSIISFEDKINAGLSQGEITLIPKKNLMYCLIRSKNKENISTIIKFIQQSLPLSTIFISRSVEEVEDLFISYTDLSFINLMNAAEQTPIYYSYSDLGIYRYLLHLSDKEKYYFIQDELQCLLNEKNSRELLDTLYMYFICQKNVSETAKALHLHTNSIYYRLNQIEKKLNVRLSNFQKNINLYSALFLERFLFLKNDKKIKIT